MLLRRFLHRYFHKIVRVITLVISPSTTTVKNWARCPYCNSSTRLYVNNAFWRYRVHKEGFFFSADAFRLIQFVFYFPAYLILTKRFRYSSVDASVWQLGACSTSCPCSSWWCTFGSRRAGAPSSWVFCAWSNSCCQFSLRYPNTIVSNNMARGKSFYAILLFQMRPQFWPEFRFTWESKQKKENILCNLL